MTRRTADILQNLAAVLILAALAATVIFARVRV